MCFVYATVYTRRIVVLPDRLARLTFSDNEKESTHKLIKLEMPTNIVLFCGHVNIVSQTVYLKSTIDIDRYVNEIRNILLRNKVCKRKQGVILYKTRVGKLGNACCCFALMKPAN
jgi:hypothetical protein